MPDTMGIRVILKRENFNNALRIATEWVQQAVERRRLTLCHSCQRRKQTMDKHQQQPEGGAAHVRTTLFS